MSYGLQIDNLAVRQNYKSLNMIAKGDSVAYGQLTVFHFSAPSGANPVIYIKPKVVGAVVAPHVLHKVSSTQWAAYFVGQVTAYVFTELAPSASGGYGIEIYNDAGNVFYDTETIPAKPIKTVTIDAVKPDRRSQTVVVPPKTAFNLHGNRMAMSIDFFSRRVYGWRDFVVRDSSGYYLTSKKVLDETFRSGWTIDRYLSAMGQISNKFPVSISFIDVEGL